MASGPSAGFWRLFGAALACYLAIGIVRAIRGGANGFVLLALLLLGFIFALWFPRAASLTLVVLALIVLALTIFVSSDPTALRLLIGFLSLVAAYLAFRANRVAAHAVVESHTNDDKPGPETRSDDP